MVIAGPPVPGSPTDHMKAEEPVEGVASGDDGEDEDMPALAGMVRDPKTGEWVLLGELLLGESKRRKGFVIDPNSKWREKWDFFIMLLLLFTATITPFEVAFMETNLCTAGGIALYTVNRLVDTGFICDMFMNFFVAYFSEEESKWIYDNAKIRKQYMSTWFFIDLVSVLPFDSLGFLMGSPLCQSEESGTASVSGNATATATSEDGNAGEELSQLKIMRVIRLLRLIKLLRILKSARIFRRMQTALGMTFTTVALTKFLVMILFSMHWTSCVWNIVPQIDEGPGWLEDTFGEDVVDANGNEVTEIVASISEKYFISIEFSLMTMVIGYGKVEPVTESEQIVAIIFLILNGSMYAYVIGAICGIVSMMDPATTHFNQQMDHLNGFMAEINFPYERRNHFRDYFNFCKNKFRIEYYLELLEKMSPTMQGEISLHQHSEWISKIPFFNCDEEDERDRFVASIAMTLSPKAFASGELLVVPGETAEAMHIINKGLVGVAGRVKSKGAFIGEDFVMTDYERDYRATCLTFIDVYELTKESLDEQLDSGKFPRTRGTVRWATIRMAFKAELKSLREQAKEAGDYEPMTKESILAWKARMMRLAMEKSIEMDQMSPEERRAYQDKVMAASFDDVPDDSPLARYKNEQDGEAGGEGSEGMTKRAVARIDALEGRCDKLMTTMEQILERL